MNQNEELRLYKTELDENLTDCGCHLLIKGDNQGGNRGEKVATDDNSLENNNLSHVGLWINVSEGSNRLGIKKQTIKKHIKLYHFETRKVKMNGGWGYEISVESMFRYYESIGDWDKCNRILELITGKEEIKPISGANDISEEALAKYQVCRMLDMVLMNSSRKVRAVENFVVSFNAGMYKTLLDIIGPISVRSVYRWYKLLKDNGWELSVLEPGWNKIERTNRTISNREAEILIPLILNPNRPLISEIIKQAKEEFLKRGIAIKSDVTYRRFINEWSKKNVDLWTLGRYGMKAFNDKIMKDILRDKDRVEAGDIVVADGHTLNVMVINPLTGKPQRMTLIMFFDFKSSMPLGWEIMPTENVQAIASALRRTILLLGRFFINPYTEGDGKEVGFVPRVVYLDNGKAFRAKYFNGVKDFRDTIIPGLFGKLGIEVMYATPYHGQSKTVERWFRTLGEMERRLPAYTGTSISGKPAMLLRNEKLHKRLFDNTPIEVESLAATLQEYIKEYAEQPHQDGQYKGLCPAEIFMHSINKLKSQPERLKGRIISKSELNYLMLSDETRIITKNGIRFRGNYYYNEEMPRIIGSRVVIKYDIWDDRDILVLDEKERFLFIASKEDMRYHPAARLLGTEEDVAMLQEALIEKQRMKRETVEEFKAIVAMRVEEVDKTAKTEKTERADKKKKESEMERKKKAIREYMKLIGYENPFENPVERLLNRKEVR